jgi:hypothetical protein
MNDAALDLPEEFTDGTMHLFSTRKDAASKFTFVVSRADMEPGDTVDTFVERLVSQMRKTLPRFELRNIQVREIDGENGREIEYVWVSEGTPLHQIDAAKRPNPDVNKLLNGFTDWLGKQPSSTLAQYNGVLGSGK